MTGRLERIWVKRSKRGVMDERKDARLVAGQGLEGNANQGGRRQVTLLDVGAWGEALEELSAELDPVHRRANLLVSGLSLADSRGQVLRVGGVRIRINGETRPCERMDEALGGLREALQPGWRAGAFGEVLDSGVVRVGDAAGWLSDSGEGNPSS